MLKILQADWWVREWECHDCGKLEYCQCGTQIHLYPLTFVYGHLCARSWDPFNSLVKPLECITIAEHLFTNTKAKTILNIWGLQQRLFFLLPEPTYMLFLPMCLINALACVCVFMTIKVNVTTSTIKVIWGHLNPFSWLMVSSVWFRINYPLFHLEWETCFVLMPYWRTCLGSNEVVYDDVWPFGSESSHLCSVNAEELNFWYDFDWVGEGVYPCAKYAHMQFVFSWKVWLHQNL